MKKVELVIEKAFLNSVLEKFETLRIGGYTVLDAMQGKGGRSGNVKNYGITDLNRTCYIFTICSIEEHENIVKSMTPFIEKTGGILICSDVTSFNLKSKKEKGVE